MMVSLTAVVLWVTVKMPSTGPDSLPSVVPAMLTDALSPSRMLTLSLAVPMLMPGSDAVMAVSVTVTVSVPSTRPSATMPVTSMLAVVVPAGIVTVPLSTA